MRNGNILHHYTRSQYKANIQIIQTFILEKEDKLRRWNLFKNERQNRKMKKRERNCKVQGSTRSTDV